MADRDILVDVRNLTKEFGDGVKFRALDCVSFTVRRGEFIAVMGPSGSGKSTLLNLLGALDRPTSGLVCMNGEDLSRVRDLDSFRSRTVGFIFQMHNLIPTLNAEENVDVPMQGAALSRQERHTRAKELLALVGMEARRHHLPNQLSGGERQRVAIARSLANRPALVLADEPTGNLDTQNGAEVLALMRTLNRELGTTFLIVTHDPAIARKTDRILTMRDGKLVRQTPVGSGPEEDLRTLAESDLGHALVAESVDVPAEMTSEERRVLRDLVVRLAGKAS